MSGAVATGLSIVLGVAILLGLIWLLAFAWWGADQADDERVSRSDGQPSHLVEPTTPMPRPPVRVDGYFDSQDDFVSALGAKVAEPSAGETDR